MRKVPESPEDFSEWRTLTAADLDAAHKQLLAVERGWRDCETSLVPRPFYRDREDRIRATHPRA